VADQPHAELLTITPEMAQDWLETRRRPNNRKIRMSHVRRLQRDMEAGRFLPNNDAISFDAEGFLLNGHHRLYACGAAGVPFRSFVHWQLPNESFVTMDIAAKRSMSDSLQMSDIPHAGIVGRALSLLWRIENNCMIGPVEATYQDLQALYIKDRKEIDAAAQFIRELRMGGTLVSPMALFFLVIFRRIHPAKADEFMISLATGANLARSSPILLLRNTLLARRRHPSSAAITPNQLLAAVFRAWTLFLEGKSSSTLILKSADMEQILKRAPERYGIPKRAAS
jgi:hypothetical protein